mgnify:CR=1 FL=1
MKTDILLLYLTILSLAFIVTNTYFGSGFVVFKIGAEWQFLDYLRLCILLFIACGVTISGWSILTNGWNIFKVSLSVFFFIALVIFLYYLQSHLTFWDTAYFFATGPTSNKWTLTSPKDGFTILTFWSLKYLWWAIGIFSIVAFVGLKVRQHANSG